jgi:hypothetical protein
MGVPTSEVCYTSATTGRKDHEVHKGHVGALENNNNNNNNNKSHYNMILSYYACNIIEAEYVNHINDGIEVNMMCVHE